MANDPPSSRAGMTIGGWLTIRYFPSTRSASLESACRLSRVWALATFCFAVFSMPWASFLRALPFWVATASSMVSISCSSDRRAYQMSRVPICANSAIASRYARTAVSVASRVSSLVNALFRAAMVKLAAMRLTSYSNGPGRVSSKSLRSNNRVRSGEAKTPKLDRWASPHSWDDQAGPRGVFQIGCHDLGGAPIERER